MKTLHKIDAPHRRSRSYYKPSSAYTFNHADEFVSSPALDRVGFHRATATAKKRREIYQLAPEANRFTAITEFHSYKPKPAAANDGDAVLHWLTAIWAKKSDFDQILHQQLSDKLYELVRHSELGFEDLNPFSFRIANYLIQLLVEFKVRPARMAKSVEGSISFEFNRPEYFASIEVFNDGDIVFLQDTDKGVSAQDITSDQLRDSLAKIVKRFT